MSGRSKNSDAAVTHRCTGSDLPRRRRKDSTAKARRREAEPLLIHWRGHKSDIEHCGPADQMTLKDFVHVLTRLIDEIEREYQAASLVNLRIRQRPLSEFAGTSAASVVHWFELHLGELRHRFQMAHRLMQDLLERESHV